MKPVRLLSLSLLFGLITVSLLGVVDFDRRALASCDPPPEAPKKPPKK